jgi:hypothetical protein
MYCGTQAKLTICPLAICVIICDSKLETPSALAAVSPTAELLVSVGAGAKVDKVGGCDTCGKPKLKYKNIHNI